MWVLEIELRSLLVLAKKIPVFAEPFLLACGIIFNIQQETDISKIISGIYMLKCSKRFTELSSGTYKYTVAKIMKKRTTFCSSKNIYEFKIKEFNLINV